MNSFIKAGLVVIVAVVIVYGLYQFAGDKLTFLHLGNRLELGETQQPVSLQNIDTIEIHSINTHINVIQAINGWGKIEFSADQIQRDTITMNQQENSLIVSIHPQSSNVPYSMTFKLPKSIKVVKVNIKSGHVNVDNIKLTHLIIHSLSGNIKLDNADVDQLDLTSISGSILANGEMKQFMAKTVSSPITIHSSFESPDYDINTISGNIDLMFNHLTLLTVDVKSLSGRVYNNLVGYIHNEADSKNENARIKVRSVSGNIRLGV